MIQSTWANTAVRALEVAGQLPKLVSAVGVELVQLGEVLRDENGKPETTALRSKIAECRAGLRAYRETFVDSGDS